MLNNIIKKINPLKIFKNYWHKGVYQKIKVVFFSLIILAFLVIYILGQIYIYSERNIPYQMGVTFVPDYAESLGLNPNQTLNALLNINIKNFRFTSYWSDIEPKQNTYNFSELDQEFSLANAHHAKVLLVVGLRQPRWPECHPPNWIAGQKTATWENELYSFMSKVVNRYKNNPALYGFQVENEYFLKGFGDCTNFSRNRLIHEYNLVKSLAPNKEILVTRSNNAIGFPINKPTPDIFGISIYKRVWDANITHRYLEYPFPSWYYGFLAEVQRFITGKDMIITELQAEAWPPKGQAITNTTLNVQNESMNAKMLKNRFSFAKATGMRKVYFWGAEYWYYRMEVLHDPSLWKVAKQEFR